MSGGFSKGAAEKRAERDEAAKTQEKKKYADSKKKTRRHTRDFDQIHADLHDKRHLEQFHETQTREELPAFGDFYCIECAKFYESEANYKSHQKSKPHKRRVKALKEEPYSQKEAEAAAGYGSAVAKKDDDAEDSMIVEE